MQIIDIADGFRMLIITRFFIRNQGSARQNFKKLQGWIDRDLRNFQIFPRIYLVNVLISIHSDHISLLEPKFRSWSSGPVHKVIFCHQKLSNL